MRVGNKPRSQEASGSSAANGHTQRTREWGHRRNRQSERSWRRHQYRQRVMDCGGAGHILLSKHVAEDVEEYPHWQPHLHELGDV